ncbi:hypothetical protein [Allorhizocola rhizosphaerae]|uniref:hypothetical protein n=1 Tax=Allorhizocola rhizosphaerae TaxID=1872709 RepID=UPI000E3BA56D|nr:hypothetical protein [Allorhizocola rhizosphaerae]
MINELRDTMQRQASGLTPKPDPYRRLMLRRTRRRTIVATTVATMLLSLAAPAGVLLARNGFVWEASRPGGEPPAELQPLLSSRTRGTLAEDSAFLEAIRARAAAEITDTRSYEGAYMPADPDAIRVLFAGDVAGCGRVVVLAGVTGRPLHATYAGSPGDEPQQLRLVDAGRLSPVAQPAWTGSSGRYQLIFGPEGSHLEFSVRTRYLRDGPVTDWHPVNTEVYLATSSTTLPGTRVRVSTTGVAPVEVQPMAVRAVMTPAVRVDEESLRGHGESVRRAAEEAALLIARRTGLTSSDAKYMLRWGGQVAAAPIATVIALTPDGGGPFATVALDPANPSAPITHPTGDGAVGDPARSVIVHRLPGASDHLLIIAPQSAVQAKIVQGGTVLTRVDLHQGVGWGRLSEKLTVVVRALDPAGAIVAEAGFYDAP